MYFIQKLIHQHIFTLSSFLLVEMSEHCTLVQFSWWIFALSYFVVPLWDAKDGSTVGWLLLSVILCTQGFFAMSCHAKDRSKYRALTPKEVILSCNKTKYNDQTQEIISAWWWNILAFWTIMVMKNLLEPKKAFLSKNVNLLKTPNCNFAP